MTLPNQLTVLRMVLTPIAVFLLLAQDVAAKRIGTGVFLIASLTDWYDGHFARKYGYVTNWGKFLDPLADKILISSMLLCFVLLNYIKAVWVVIIVVRDVLITALRGYMMMYDKPIAANLLAKWKTFSQVGLVYMILILVNVEASITSSSAMPPAIDMAAFSGFIDKFAQFVAYFTVLTGVLYLIDNGRPLLELFGRFYRWIIPFNFGSETKPENDRKDRANDPNRKQKGGNSPDEP